MDRIFQYDKRAKKDFDWALKTLHDCQDRRRSRERSGELAESHLGFALSLDISAAGIPEAAAAQKRLRHAVSALNSALNIGQEDPGLITGT
jgi:hypothetical protein